MFARLFGSTNTQILGCAPCLARSNIGPDQHALLSRYRRRENKNISQIIGRTQIYFSSATPLESSGLD